MASKKIRTKGKTTGNMGSDLDSSGFLGTSVVETFVVVAAVVDVVAARENVDRVGGTHEVKGLLVVLFQVRGGRGVGPSVVGLVTLVVGLTVLTVVWWVLGRVPGVLGAVGEVGPPGIEVGGLVGMVSGLVVRTDGGTRPGVDGRLGEVGADGDVGIGGSVVGGPENGIQT